MQNRLSTIWVFVLLALGISWGASAGVVLLLSVDARLPAVGLLLVAKFGPSLAAIAIAARFGGEPGLKRLLRPLTQGRVGLRWYAVVLIGPGLLLACASLGAAWIHGGMAATSSLAACGTLLWLIPHHTFLGGGLGEEIGWRGFMLPVLAARAGALRASVVIGVIWAIWHAPMFFIPGGWDDGPPWVGLLLYLALTPPLSILFTRVYFGTDRSLIPVVLLHAAINAFAGTSETWLPALEETLTDDWIAVALIWLAASVVLARTGPDLGMAARNVCADQTATAPSSSVSTHQIPISSSAPGTTNRNQ